MGISKTKGLSARDLEELKPLLTNTPDGHRMLASYSDKYFAKYYLESDLYPQQLEWMRRLQLTRNGAELSPVEHGKTFGVSGVLPTKRICYNRNIRILLISGTADLAIKNVGVISRSLKGNKKIITDFGPFYNYNNTWGKTQIQVIRDDPLIKDYSVEAIGVFGEITGSRFDLIIADDPVTEKNSRTAEPRNRLRDFMFGTVFTRADKGAQIWCIGTRKDYADFWSELIKKKAIWSVNQGKAIIQEPDDYEIVELDEPKIREDGTEKTHEVIIKGNPGKTLDPVRWPMERLLLRRYEIGTRLFDREFQNTITSDGTALFKLQWLEQCRKPDLSYANVEYRMVGNGVELTGHPNIDRSKYIRIFACTDPAIVTDKKTAEANDSDYFVAFILGLYENGSIDILYRIKDRGFSPTQKIELSIALNKLFRPSHHFWESNSAGQQDIALIEEATNVPLIPHYTGANKNDSYGGVTSLSVMVERNRMGFPYKTEADMVITDDIISEFHRYPNGEHDDQVMAAWIGKAGADRVLDEYKYLKKKGKA
jgi:phage terminase large subunit-like protein